MLVSHKVRHEQLSSARGLGLEQAFELRRTAVRVSSFDLPVKRHRGEPGHTPVLLSDL